ncbi:hypothetical protein NMG60_11020528 [Bertholletia excelsa]
MAKKRTRHQNPEPFLTDDTLISSSMSSKILREALIQQKEIEDEAERQNPDNVIFGKEPAKAANSDEDDIDDFGGFSETQSQFGGPEDAIDEGDEKLLEAFMSKDAVEKIKERDAQVSSEVQPLLKLDDSIIDLYKGVGRLLSRYTSGKVPKAFKHIPSMQLWEEVLYVTEPEKWLANAMYQATRIFASNMGVKKAERFYKLVLLPRVREDIRKNRRLHFALYQSLKKSLYKPAAFNKGILFPLCESRTCNLREAVIIGNIIQKVSIPPLHSSYFIKLLIEKKYALPFRVLDAMVGHFMKFVDDERIMPVIWHQSLLAFVQRYKNELRKEDKVNINKLVEKQRHKLVTPEILRELNNSCNRGEEDDLMSINILFVDERSFYFILIFKLGTFLSELC